ncbi:hypothetical protein TVWG_00031 [Tetraselmis viridis virus N1]|nr:hypothetical protein TVWG_00031 [Tetraselmis viridis virus N1]
MLKSRQAEMKRRMGFDSSKMFRGPDGDSEGFLYDWRESGTRNFDDYVESTANVDHTDVHNLPQSNMVNAIYGDNPPLNDFEMQLVNRFDTREDRAVFTNLVDNIINFPVTRQDLTAAVRSNMTDEGFF